MLLPLYPTREFNSKCKQSERESGVPRHLIFFDLGVVFYSGEGLKAKAAHGRRKGGFDSLHPGTLSISCVLMHFWENFLRKCSRGKLLLWLFFFFFFMNYDTILISFYKKLILLSDCIILLFYFQNLFFHQLISIKLDRILF